MKNNREYRTLNIEVETRNEAGDPSYIVRGYASTFEPYVLFTDEDGNEYSEIIEPTAFDGADLSDVVFRIDHEGTVYARSSAGTLEVGVDDHGLFDRADLSKTAKARGLFEDIAAGNYPKQSFAFTVAEDEYDRKTRTRTIKRIAKVFDVSPVSFPANPTTELDIATRSYFDGVIEAERAERLESEKRNRLKATLELKLKLAERDTK
ncbi:MAG: HK97 family phage prohead protease [Clostridia bacterium]|nr:HK97 family phage prohead protease [Clostridia bacterium]